VRKVVGIVGGLTLAAAIAAVTMGNAQGTTVPVFKLKKGDQCLVAGSSGAVTMGRCGSTKASWSKAGPSFDMLYNKGTGTCMEAQGRSLKAAACDRKDVNQANWFNVPSGAADGHPTIVVTKRYKTDPDAVRVITKWDAGSVSLEKETAKSSNKALWKFVLVE
jgi:hypothetical protein